MALTKNKKQKDDSAKPTETKKFEQRDFTGALFENSKKTTDKQPDYTGTVVIDGVEYWISAWDKTSAKGQDYLSLGFQLKDDK